MKTLLLEIIQQALLRPSNSLGCLTYHLLEFAFLNANGPTLNLSTLNKDAKSIEKFINITFLYKPISDLFIFKQIVGVNVFFSGYVTFPFQRNHVIRKGEM